MFCILEQNRNKVNKKYVILGDGDMRKKILCAILCFYCLPVYADRCVLNSPDIINSAFQKLQNIDVVVSYCPTCVGDNRVRYVNVSDISVVQAGNEQMISLSDEHLDLAYIYLPTEEKNIYHNLGYIVNCADLANSPVLEYIDVTNPYGIEHIEDLLRQVEKCNSDSCVKNIYNVILHDYFDDHSHILKGFPLETITFPTEISKQEIIKLLNNISFYYGRDFMKKRRM